MIRNFSMIRKTDGKAVATITTHEKGRFFTGSILSDELKALTEISIAFNLQTPLTPEMGLPYIRINKVDFNKMFGLPSSIISIS